MTSIESASGAAAVGGNDNIVSKLEGQASAVVDTIRQLVDHLRSYGKSHISASLPSSTAASFPSIDLYEKLQSLPLQGLSMQVSGRIATRLPGNSGYSELRRCAETPPNVLEISSRRS